MKRNIALCLLCLSLFACFSPAQASDKQKITFRNIPWGSSPVEALELLQEDLSQSSLRFSVSYETVSGVLASGGNDRSSSVDMLKCTISVSGLKVAGYETAGYTSGIVTNSMTTKVGKNNIILYFMPSPSTLTLSEQEGYLWRAVYPVLCRPSGKWITEMQDDLCTKLDNLYGQSQTRTYQSMKLSKGKWYTEKKDIIYWEQNGARLELSTDTDYNWYNVFGGVAISMLDVSTQAGCQLDYRSPITYEMVNAVTKISEAEVQEQTDNSFSMDSSGL